MNEVRIVGDAAWHNLVLTGPNRRVCSPCPKYAEPACRFTSGQIGHSRTQLRKYGQYPAEHEDRLASLESSRISRWSGVGHQRRLRRLTGISALPPESRHPDDRRCSSVWAIRYRVEPQ